MFIASVASHVLSSAITALTKPNSSTTPISPPKTRPNGSTQSNNPTGSTNPFQTLSADMQSWLTQNQAGGGSVTQPFHHHHHGADAQQQAGDSTDPAAPTTA
jgi:hypothetical protein